MLTLLSLGRLAVSRLWLFSGFDHLFYILQSIKAQIFIPKII